MAQKLPEPLAIPTLVTRHCPNCGGMAAPTASITASTPSEMLSYDQLSESWRGFFSDSCFFSYHRCISCKQLFAPTYLSEPTLNAFYGAMEDNIHSGDEHLSRLTQEEYCAATTRYVKTAKRYLEIGPDVGLFVSEAKKRFGVEEAFLVEPNRKVWPRLEAAAAGLKPALFPSIDAIGDTIPDDSLDLVVAVHVLDHLLVPTETLDWIQRKLTKGGVAVFVVHNERSLLARIMGNRFPAYCMQHPQLYNPATLAGSLEHAGLKVNEVKRTANYFPINYLMSHVIFALTKRRINLPWPKLPLRLKLGNIVAIASKV